MENLIKDFLSCKNFAVVGSFRKETKIAWKILKTLKLKGIKVYPVNPAVKEVDGAPCWPNILAIKGSVEVVNMVTSGITTEKNLQECLEKGIKKIWL